MSSANDRQVGGSHYSSTSGLQHWDLIELYGVGYLEGCATKYLQRWRKKNGLQDLEKAAHYIQKLIELHGERGRMARGNVPAAALQKFCWEDHEMGVQERSAITLLCTWSTEGHLRAALKEVEELIALERVDSAA
jgi:hypothetical protein